MHCQLTTTVQFIYTALSFFRLWMTVNGFLFTGCVYFEADLYQTVVQYLLLYHIVVTVTRRSLFWFSCTVTVWQSLFYDCVLEIFVSACVHLSLYLIIALIVLSQTYSLLYPSHVSYRRLFHNHLCETLSKTHPTIPTFVSSTTNLTHTSSSLAPHLYISTPFSSQRPQLPAPIRLWFEQTLLQRNRLQKYSHDTKFEYFFRFRNKKKTLFKSS